MDKGKPSRLPVPAVAAVVVLALLILYVLSIGPATWLEENAFNPTMHEFLMWFYLPITWLCYEVPMVGKVVEWYLGFWRDSP